MVNDDNNNRAVHAERYADLMLDWTFKKVFGENGKKLLLISLLESVLGFGIEDIQYLPQEVNSDSFENKRFRMDLRCRCNDGTRIIVEVQTYWQEFFPRRCMTYAASEFVAQSGAGKTYGMMDPVYLVVLLSESATAAHSFHSPEFRGRVIYRYIMSERDSGELFFDAINIIFVELGDFMKDGDECDDDLDRWLFVLKNMKRLETLPPEFQSDVFRTLFEAAEVARFNRDDMDAYTKARLIEMDRLNILQSAEKSGLERGRAEGLAEGVAQEKAGIAMKMKAKGLDINLIAQCTGLTLEEIERL